MKESKQIPKKENQQNYQAVQHENESSAGKSLMPPPLQFKGGNAEEEELQMKSATVNTPYQFKPADEEEEMQMKSAAPNIQPFQFKSSSPNGMPEDVQAKMENSFGQDFSNVNIHANSENAVQLNALAYAQGNDVHFAPGQYNPNSQKGQELLGHELTHVVQQREGRVKPTVQGKGMPINDSPALEKEADVMGIKAARGEFIQLSKKNDEVSVPETLGNTQVGPIAVKGTGDDHEFAPNDVDQGSLGDCYFLAALMAIAQSTPKLLKDNISENSDGTYNVKLYHKKVEKGFFGDSVSFTPTIYKIFPTFPKSANASDTANPSSSTEPPHAHRGDTNTRSEVELWVRLFEKAYALMRGSYKEMGNGGSRVDALETLTGEEFEWHGTKGNSGWLESDEEHISEKIIDMMKNDIPVTAGTGGLDLSSLPKEMQTYAAANDIVIPHAYAVIYADSSKVKVRNPWGQEASVQEPEMSWTYFINFFPFITEKS